MKVSASMTRFKAPVLFMLLLAIAIGAEDASQTMLQRAEESSQSSRRNLPEMNSMSMNPSLQNYSVFQEGSASQMELSSPDNSLDANSYYIGGGDVFRVFIADYPSLNYTGVVNENGDLFFRSIGIISLGKISLAQAKETIADFFKSKLKKPNTVRVALVKVKTVTFSLSGAAITNPGTYVAPGHLRVWDAIKMNSKDFNNTTPPTTPVTMATPVVPPITAYIKERDLRAVYVRHSKDSTVSHYDLLPYLLKGDLAQNPYLYPGDQITVNPATSCIYLDGEVNTTLRHYVPIRSNERVADFLSLFFYDPNSDSEHISVQRNNDENRTEKIVYNMKSKENGDLVLKNNDIITVPLKKDETEIFVVRLRGEVGKPGYYPITKDKTTAREMIEEAGSFTEFANKDKAAIVRRANLPAELFYHGSKEDVAEPLATMRPELSSALFMMNATKDYTVILLSKNPNVILQPGDELFIPRSNHTVYVSGSVQRPGAYPFTPGKKINYYVDLAGGYTSRSNKENVSIAAVYGQAFQTPDRKIVEDGDVVIVPLAQQYKFLSTVIMPISSLVFASVGFLISILTFARQK